MHALFAMELEGSEAPEVAKYRYKHSVFCFYTFSGYKFRSDLITVGSPTGQPVSFEGYQTPRTETCTLGQGRASAWMHHPTPFYMASPNTAANQQNSVLVTFDVEWKETSCNRSSPSSPV